MITILVVDEHDAFRRALRASLGCEPGIDIVGEAASGEEALDMINRARPDVVVTGLLLVRARVDGLTLTALIRDIYPECQVVVYTMYFDDKGLCLAAREAGAVAVIDKAQRFGELVSAIKSAAYVRRRPSRFDSGRAIATSGSRAAKQSASPVSKQL